MAQRTVIRMNVADFLGKGNPEPASPVPDTLYYVTESRVLRDHLDFGVVPYPVRSLAEARNLVSRIYPRARSVMAETNNSEFVHITWREDSGEEVIVRIAEEHNPAVFASSRDTPLYLITHRKLWVLGSPPHDISGLGGTFISQDEANAVAHRIFQEKVGDNRVKTHCKDDGCLEYRAGHPDPRREGYMWEVDVNRIGWSGDAL
ncbi:MAG: hypothetical protein Q9209_002320 [Squamulea sp. 1 TL-2023]